ncbi:MAG: hypothetical protein HOO67_03720 [Candidatus Peribacteraceae bacterium]|nr:hypothetical protein [Candidatus Peribacteraceae bacterium]
MIINADSLLPHLREKVRPTKSDDSRHVLCPQCAVRTKLNILGDGRRKCTACGKKFRIHKVTDSNKLRQCAEILLCFCLDFPALTAAQITHHRYRLVAEYYDHFRTLIEKKSPVSECNRHEGSYIEIFQAPREKSWCTWCKSKVRTAEGGGKTPVFGVRFRDNDDVELVPLVDLQSQESFKKLLSRQEAPGCRDGYTGFVCCGKFNAFAQDARAKDNEDKLWTWIRERIRTHNALWKRNSSSYLKELEWKYNNRSLDPDLQAKNFIELMPVNFLTSWEQEADTPARAPSR